jgi:hypothetical protein
LEQDVQPSGDSGFFSSIAGMIAGAGAVLLFPPSAGEAIVAMSGASVGGNLASAIHSKVMNDHGGVKLETDSYEKCQSSSKGKRWSKGTAVNDNTAADWRTGLNFAMGFKTPYAPFSEFAAGALLAVQEIPSPTGGVQKLWIRPLVRNNFWTVPANGKIQLFVNDCSVNTRPENTPHLNFDSSTKQFSQGGGLTVTVRQLQSKEQAVRTLSKVFETVLKRTFEEAPRYLRMGSFSPTDQQELRSRIVKDLRILSARENGGQSIDFERDPELAPFFQHWIDRAVLSLAKIFNCSSCTEKQKRSHWKLGHWMIKSGRSKVTTD